MLYNYHTHTTRCNHATGTDREYVEAAIKRGLKVLGFADHAPYLFPDTDFQSGYRMRLEQTEDYVQSVRKLAKEYEKDIKIYCGFELEYYPDFHKEEKAFLMQFKPDYFIMGQHFVGNEIDGHYYINTKGNEFLTSYVTQVLAGLATGDFLYLAHPDVTGVVHFSAERIESEYRRLCKGAKCMGIPLEINLLGLRGNRHYPTETFFKIAGEEGNDILLGMDAHSPEEILETESEKRALEMVEKFDLKLLNAPLPMTFTK